jgi:hypothetical protein
MRILILLGLLWLSACAVPLPAPTPAPAPTAVPTANPLQGGVLATFELNDQTFKVWVRNLEAIQALYQLEAGGSSANIPNGKILPGPGQGDHNAPYTWHLDPDEIDMAEFTVEVCDAEPDYVQENVDEFVNVVGRYCPWSATLVSLEDFR